MNFSDNIPELLIAEAPLRFVKVLDGVHEEKQLIIAKALRENNSVLLNDPKWLLLRLADYGLTNIPYEMPVGILQQVLLNASTLIRLRGSKKGLELFCSVFSLGQVSFDDSSFYAVSTVIWPDSVTEGYLTADNVNPYFYILDDSTQLVNVEPLAISIATPYNTNSLVKEFIQSTVKDWLGFSPGKQITFTFSHRATAYYHSLLNPYFV